MSFMNELLQKYVNMSYEELLELARYSLSELLDPLVADRGRENASKTLAVVTAACLGTDGKFSSLEHRFLNDLLGCDSSYEENLRYVRDLGNDEARDLVNNWVDSLSSKQKAAAISFCTCLLAVDETITREETAFIARRMD